jgi:penicillin-binding protein 1A
MPKRSDTRRVEPKFGDAGQAGLAVSPEDRPDGASKGGRKTPRERKVHGARRGWGRRRTGDRPRRSLLSRIFRRTFYWGFVLSLWGGIAVAGVVAYYAAQLPGGSEWKVPDRPPNIQILAVDGTLIGNRGDTGGESVRIEQLPPYVPNAVIAIEDRRFRSHFGVDPIGLTRAAVKNYTAGGTVEGGSTLTQQLAKNMFLSPERSLKRKVQEVVLAVWLEAKFSKDEILEMYLNRVYFGSGAYGIDAAARRYFDRDATELTVPQAAMLAGLLPAPSAYSPNKNPKAARDRANLVLAAMADQGYITDADLTQARDEPAKAVTAHMTRSENYVADWVMDVLPFHLGSIERDVVVETTVDLQLQDGAEKALVQTLDEEGDEYEVSEGAMVVLDGTGAVRAMVGGRSYAKSQFNRAVDAKRQPGSSFKPFVYLTAIERLGLRPDTVRVDEPVTFGNWSPKNSNNKFRGPVQLRDALADSINTIAAKLAVEVGPDAVVETARRMGINSPMAANASIALGTSEVSLLELTGAYAPFSNGGYAVAPFVIQRIRTPDGDVLFERKGSGLGQVASPETVAMMNYMMQATVESGTGTKAAIEGWHSAGKTGTSQDFRDAWFLGYTANLTAGVWVGNDSNAPTKRTTGGSLPAMIWSKFMTEAHEGVPVAELPGAEMMAALLQPQEPVAQEQWGVTQAAQAAPVVVRERRGLFGRRIVERQPRRERRGFFRRMFGGG